LDYSCFHRNDGTDEKPTALDTAAQEEHGARSMDVQNS
jgi:hypothetical protein